MKKFRWLATLMVITILGITGFQLYWLKNNYDREKAAIDLQTNATFRQTLLRLQASKMRLETFRFDSAGSLPPAPNIMIRNSKGRRAEVRTITHKDQPITLINLLQEKMKDFPLDSTFRNSITISTQFSDSMKAAGRPLRGRVSTVTVSTGDSLVNIDPTIIREIAANQFGRRDTTGKKNRLAFKLANKIADSLRNLPLTPAEPPGLPGPASDDREVIHQGRVNAPGRDAVFRFLYNIDSISLKDSVTTKEIDSAYAERLRSDKLHLNFSVNRIDSTLADSTSQNEVTIGFSNPVTYRLNVNNKTGYIIGQLKLPILFSIFLIGITVLSFMLLYRSMLKQRNLAELKNQFISNITHELKTPIATVGVAIEALRNFNAIQDPQRTQEYLDISQNELQRLGLLVDKVLKLSVFEKKDIELKKERFDFRQLTEEIMNSMKLQFDKYRAKVHLHTIGDNFVIDADKLHVTSVIYNLLDNALKYSQADPMIQVSLASHPEFVEFSVTDNGIGIQPEYRRKIFDKFFRVPTGNKHNIKGYGLGLSYVAEVIKRHHGQVAVQSEFGKGSTFTAQIPFS